MRRVFVLIVALAVLAPPSGARAATGGQFVIRCQYSHTMMDDPIVFPGQPGASHSHDFYGNTTTNAFSTVESMLVGSTKCRVQSDTAGYWAPTAYLNGVQLTPTVMRIYYLGNPKGPTETIPPGMRIIAGSRSAASPAENPHVHWYCGETRTIKTPRSDGPYDCNAWSQYSFVDGVVAIVDFPSCWDGVGLDTASLAYPIGGECPATYSHVLPRLSERIHYGVMSPRNPDGSVALTLSSGPYWTMHADFWNTWQQARLDDLVDSCLSGVHCGGIDAGAGADWTRQFGTTADDQGLAATAGRDGPYVAGSSSEGLPGQTHHRHADAFLRAYDATGEERWTREFGTSGQDQALATAVAGDLVAVAGFTDGRLPEQTSAGGEDAFAATFSTSGEPRWLLQLGSRGGDRATAIASAGGSGVYVAGWTNGRMTRAEGAAERDAWVAKLSRRGRVQWIRQFGSPGDDEVHAIAVLGTRVIVAGWTDSQMPGQTTSGVRDAFLRAYTAGGRIAWTRQLGTAGSDEITSLAADTGRVFAAGTTDGAFVDEQAAGGLDGFVLEMDDQGTPGWADQFGTASDDGSAALVTDDDGVFVVGSTLGALGDTPQAGDGDVFARRYLRTGALVWTIQIGTTALDQASGVGIDAGGLYLAGTTLGAFGDQTSSGGPDAFLTRIRFT